MKKLLISAVLGLAVAAQAATITVNVPSATLTNLLTILNGSVKVSQISVSSTSTNYVQLWDCPTSILVWSNAAYSTTTSFVTNSITNSIVGFGAVYTNYYGSLTTNQMLLTNILVDVSSTVATVTNNYPMRVAVAVPANSTVTLTGPYIFNSGIWATNTQGTGSTVTLTYFQ